MRERKEVKKQRVTQQSQRWQRTRRVEGQDAGIEDGSFAALRITLTGLKTGYYTTETKAKTDGPLWKARPT